jgi:putative DNA primase/helicase
MRPTRSIKGSVLDCVQKEMFVSEDKLDANENLINLQNGVYDLEKQELFPHSPSYYMTTQLPFAFDASAQAITWQMYLMSTFVKPRSVEFDKELAEFVQEAVGYSLTTSVCHHVTFWCYGEGANGKGVLFHALEQLGGTACMPLNVGLLKRELYQLADLAGKRIALCSESSATNSLVEDAYVKALVGGDTMNVRKIRKDPFVLEPKCKLWWSMNELPAVADTSEGFWRRVKVIPFNRQFNVNERILDLKEKLDAELPGIFIWAMDGLRRLRDRGRFVVPSQVSKATEQYRQEANPVALFVEEECCVYEAARMQSSVIYDAYKKWCLANNFKPHSSKNFKNEMERLDFEHKKDRDCNRFYGVELFTATSRE